MRIGQCQACKLSENINEYRLSVVRLADGRYLATMQSLERMRADGWTLPVDGAKRGGSYGATPDAAVAGWMATYVGHAQVAMSGTGGNP